MPLSQDRLRTVLAGIVIVLIVVPVGGAVWLGIILGEAPCILCWAQRASMALVALVGLFVIRYGPRPRYIGMVVLLGAWGVFMSLRHSSLHLARDVGQGFAAPFFGVHTYVWAGFIHWVVLGVVGALLLFLREEAPGFEPRDPGRLGRLAIWLFLLVVGANALQAFVTTGPPPFMGQSDPVRFSLNPRHWVWRYGDELGGSMSLRGAWAVPRPDPAAGDVDADPANGPLASLPVLDVERRLSITAPLDGRLTGLAHDSATDRFLAITDHHGVYVLDGTLARAEHSVVLDHQYSIDLTPLAGATFVGDTLAVMSTNKSYVLLRPDPAADPDREWRHFRQTDGSVTELLRSRFSTERARMMFALALAYDPEADELITVTVPSPRHQSLVVSRFAREDRLLSSEFEPRLAAGLALSDPSRSLADYVVTGSVAADGMLYALSAAYSTLLVIDLRTKLVAAAYAVPGIERPVGLAARGSELLVAQADGRIAVITRPQR